MPWHLRSSLIWPKTATESCYPKHSPSSQEWTQDAPLSLRHLQKSCFIPPPTIPLEPAQAFSHSTSPPPNTQVLLTLSPLNDPDPWRPEQPKGQTLRCRMSRSHGCNHPKKYVPSKRGPLLPQSCSKYNISDSIM